jgi:hypothetical protein
MADLEHFEVPVIASDGSRIRYPIYIGEPIKGAHPLEQQAAALRRERGLVIPQEIMDSFEKLAAIAVENDVNFRELVVHAMSEATEEAAADDAGTPEEDEAKPEDEGSDGSG